MATTAARTLSTTSITAARLSIVTAVAYQVLLVALIFIRPELDPSWHTISDWAIGPHGWIMQVAFEVWALSYASLVVAIHSQLRGISGKAGLAVLLICAIGTIGVGVFVTDPMPLTRAKGLSVTGALHVAFGTTALMLLPLAAVLINVNLARKNPAWAGLRRMLLWSAAVPVVGLLGSLVHLVLVVLPMGEDAYGPGVPLGWPPRLVFLSYMVWVTTLAALVIRLGGENASRDVESRPTAPTYV